MRCTTGECSEGWTAPVYLEAVKAAEVATARLTPSPPLAVSSCETPLHGAGASGGGNGDDGSDSSKEWMSPYAASCLLQRGCYAEQAAIEEQPQRSTVQAVGAYGHRLRQHRHRL